MAKYSLRQFPLKIDCDYRNNLYNLTLLLHANARCRVYRRSVAKFQTIESVISHTLACVAFVPAIKIRKVKVAFGRHNGIGDRTLQGLFARKSIRICPE